MADKTAFTSPIRHVQCKVEVLDQIGTQTVDDGRGGGTKVVPLMGWVDYSAFVVGWSASSNLSLKFIGRSIIEFDFIFKMDNPPDRLFKLSVPIRVTLKASNDSGATYFEDQQFILFTTKRMTQGEREFKIFAADWVEDFDNAVSGYDSPATNERQLKDWVTYMLSGYRKAFSQSYASVSGVPNTTYPVTLQTNYAKTEAGSFPKLVDVSTSALLSVAIPQITTFQTTSPTTGETYWEFSRVLEFKPLMTMLSGVQKTDCDLTRQLIPLSSGFESMAIDDAFYFNTIEVSGLSIQQHTANPKLRFLPTGIKIEPGKKGFYTPDLDGVIPVDVKTAGWAMLLREADDDTSPTVDNANARLTVSQVPGGKNGFEKLLFVVENKTTDKTFYLRELIDAAGYGSTNQYLVNTGEVFTKKQNDTQVNADGGNKVAKIYSPLIQSQSLAEEIAMAVTYANRGFYKFTCLATPFARAGCFCSFELKDGTKAQGLILQASFKFTKKDGFKMTLIVMRMQNAGEGGWFSWDVPGLGWDQANWFMG